MVNIKYYVDGNKVIENEYLGTNVTNINDVIKGKHLYTNHIYEIIITRHYKKAQHTLEKILYLIHLDKLTLYEKYENQMRPFTDNYFSSLAHRDSTWKIYFNKKSDIRFVKVETNIINTNLVPNDINPKFEVFVFNQKDLDTFREYKNLIVENDKMTLNGKEIDELKYEDLLTKNILIRNITIVKALSEKTLSSSNYCTIC
jgi:hypothetical protein